MDALDKWYAFFENSEEVRNLVQWLFEYLPEEMRAQVPHHMATFLIVATICLAISVVVELAEKVEPVQVLGCVACTVVCVAFSLVIAVFSFFEPLHSARRTIGAEALVSKAGRRHSSTPPVSLKRLGTYSALSAATVM